MIPPSHVLTILAVADLERAVHFYREAFGWPPRVEVPVYVELEQPDGRGLGLYRRESFAVNTGQMPTQLAEGQISGAEIYLRCVDLTATIDRLDALGARRLSKLNPLALTRALRASYSRRASRFPLAAGATEMSMP